MATRSVSAAVSDALRTRQSPPKYSEGKLTDELSDETHALWSQLGGGETAWIAMNEPSTEKLAANSEESRWEKPEFRHLLELADNELNPEIRLKYLALAEELLLQEIPILPAFQIDFRAIVKKHIQLPGISPQGGILDLKWTRFK